MRNRPIWPSSNFKIKKSNKNAHKTDRKTDNIKINHDRIALERSFKKSRVLKPNLLDQASPFASVGVPNTLGSQQGAVMTPIMYNVNINDFHIFHVF